jgi:hypothetical protein
MSISGVGGAVAGSPYSPAPAAGGVKPAAASQGLATAGKSVVEEFEAWAKMTPAQRMRANILASMGLTEDQLKGMDATRRKAVEDIIKQRIQDQVKRDTEKKTGLLVDIKA